MEWEVTSNLICGDTSINVVTSPSHQNIDVVVDENNDMVTISNLENGTMYTITVTATNRAGSVTRMINVTTLGRSSSSSSSSGAYSRVEIKLDYPVYPLYRKSMKNSLAV